MEIFDIIILAMVAGFIFLRLRSELGNTHDNEPTDQKGSEGPSLGDMLKGKTAPVEAVATETVVPFEGDPLLRKAYSDIHAKDRSFDPAGFLEGAASAYTMILEAFWQGDKDTLKNFLSDGVYAQFSGAVDARADNGHTVENRIIDIEDVKAVTADVKDSIAEITVSFKTEIIALTRDAEGHIVEGNPSDVVEVNDIWTFARDIKSKDPSWSLVATRAG